MIEGKEPGSGQSHVTKEKILLGLAPFWSPLIPPMGIASLKSFLLQYGYTVTTVDLNVEEQFKEIYNQYFEILAEYVPKNKQGNLHNIGHDVMQNHMMAHINYKNEKEYIELVKILYYQIFFFHITDSQVRTVNRLFDEFYSGLERYLMWLLDKEKPDVLGLTAYCGNLPATMFIFKAAKERYPHIRTLMGGGIFSQQMGVGSPNFDFFLEKTPFIDKVFIGEGQKLLLAYLQGELPDNKRVYTLKDINGETLDPSVVRIPDLSDFELRKYAYLGAASSRSCPNQCGFCNSRVFWGEYAKREASVVVEEMITLYKKHQFQMFYMSDSLLNHTITDLSKELIKADVPIYFDAYLRVYDPDCEPVSDIDNTLLWRRGGFYRARMGCESGSQRLLDLIGKNITIQHTREAITSLAYAGIKTTAYFLVGIPGETEEDFLQTLSLVEELKNEIYQAECAAFIYYYNGQNKSDEWAPKRKLLFPEEAKDMLITQTYIVNTDPPREVVYKRLNRFIAHINKLGIPNPFTLQEINQADERWKKLHKNAVPSLLEFKNTSSAVYECRDVKKLYAVHHALKDDGIFGF